MPYLFDTNAISETLRPRPNREYLRWVRGLSPEEQFTSIVVTAELYAGAFQSAAVDKWLNRIEHEILPSFIVLGFDLECARRYGKVRAHLRGLGRPIGDVDTQIAATSLAHSLVLVTANARHFAEVPDLQVHPFQSGQCESGG